MFQIKNIEIKYADKILLKEADLSFKRGKLYTIYGASGIGKSSLLNKIGMISPLNEGLKYYFDSKEINIRDNNEVSSFIFEEIAFIFQNQNLLRTLSVFDNLAIPLRYKGIEEERIDEKINELLNELGILELKNKYPTELSGGEEQRVAIARALVSDKTIILADEPTNSLDKSNRESVLSLFVNLSKKYNKIVIIVSHDEDVIDKGDIKLYFEDQELVSTDDHTVEKINFDKKEKWLPNIVSKDSKIKIRSKKVPIPLFLTIFVAIVVAVTVSAINFNTLFNKRYTQLLDSSLENGILVINDSLNTNTKKVVDDFLSIKDKDLNTLKNGNNISKIEPFIEFVDYGMTIENAKKYIRNRGRKQREITVDTKTVRLKNRYSIQPLFFNSTVERNTEYFDRDSKKGVFISESFIKKEKIENIKAGSEITLTYYVPVKNYEMDIEINGLNKKGDGDLYKIKTSTFKVLGIIKKEYLFNYSEKGNTFFMYINEMKNIQKQMIKNSKKMDSLGGFKVKEWKPSAVFITLKESVMVPNEIQRIKSISSNFVTISSSENYKSFKYALNYFKKILLWISVVLILLVISVLFFVFYLMNNSRKLEVGILKALGIKDNSVLFIYLRELMEYGKIITKYSLVVIIIITLASNVLMKLNLMDSVQFMIKSLIWIFVLSFSIILVSGIIPVYVTCKQSVVDTIRLNR